MAGAGGGGPWADDVAASAAHAAKAAEEPFQARGDEVVALGPGGYLGIATQRESETQRISGGLEVWLSCYMIYVVVGFVRVVNDVSAVVLGSDALTRDRTR